MPKDNSKIFAPELALQPVSVRYREHDFRAVSALRHDLVVFRDERDVRLKPRSARRFFWLLDHKVQMVFDAYDWPQQWRVDLVDISLQRLRGRETFLVRDMVLDIVVEHMGPTYRMLDLDKLGQQLVRRQLTVEQVNDVLTQAQKFLEAFLHRGAPWPPPPIMPFFRPTHDYPKGTHG